MSNRQDSQTLDTNNLNETINSIDENDQITLIIGEDKVVCNKRLLVKNSDYFRTMLTGPYVESLEDVINLKEVDVKGMRELLNLLQNKAYFLECNDIYAVISLCDMFLFEDLKIWILNKLEKMLDSSNCLEMWFTLEAKVHIPRISPLCWKAKSLCLSEFKKIANNMTMRSLSLAELCKYLSHINLQCSNELCVFESAISWYNRNKCEVHTENLSTLKKLIGCISYQSISVQELDQIINHPVIKEFTIIHTILESVKCLKIESNILHDIDDEHVRIAHALIQSNTRYLPKYLCLLLRHYGDSSGNLMYEFLHLDEETDEFKRLAYLPINQCDTLTGFGVIDYKMRMYIIGGELSIGRGLWNEYLWEFDWIQGSLEQTHCCRMPKRRHFESCVCGDNLFVVGGTGSYRVILDNMCWYNFKEDQWSNEVVLPCSGRQIKCCNLKDQLFIFSFSERCGYFFHLDTFLWTELEIDDPRNLIPKVFTPMSMFTYKDNLFFKGDKLLEMNIMQGKLKVVKITPLSDFSDSNFLGSAVNNKFVYTLYDDEDSLECLNLDNLEVQFLPWYEPLSSRPDVSDVRLSPVKLFTYHHYDLVSHDTVVNPKYFGCHDFIHN